MQRLRTPLLALALAAGAALPCAAQQTMSPQPSGGMSAGDAAHLDAMSREHANHTPAANAAAEVAPRQEVTAREVVYGTVDNKPVRGYLASPARNSRGMPGIVMIHEWWGLNDNIKAMARRLAGEGYNVLAVDMYGGRVAADPQQARAYMGDVMANTSGGASNLRSAAEFLRQRAQATRVGVVGWCFGGGWALQSALFMPDEVDATVVYYGRAVTDRDRLANLDSPLLGLFGAQDQGIPVAQVREMESLLKELGKDVTVQVYEGADHAFANPSGQAYNAAAADDAWRRTTEFFARNLKTPAASH
jgi:carboxymethylenebutenolidase